MTRYALILCSFLTVLIAGCSNGRPGDVAKQPGDCYCELSNPEVMAINGELRLWVNGEEVSGGNGAEPRTGYLCLESEGSPIEFKNIRIRELP